MDVKLLVALACLSITNVHFVRCQNLEQSIDSFINAALACRKDKNPGLTVSVVKNGKVMMAKGYGKADLSTGRPVTNRTLFGVASISKSFAAALMIKLLHERGMSIYTKPGDILSEEFQYSDHEFTQYATVRDLMTHCLGVPSNQAMRMDTNLTRKDAARLVDRSTKDVAQGYADHEVNGGLVPVPEEINKLWGVYGGSSGIMTSSLDMTKWMMMHLSGGQSDKGETVMKRALVHQLHSPQTAIRTQGQFRRPKAPFSVTDVAYAFGWINGYYKGYPTIRHTGDTYGYSSLVTLFPEMKLGIFTSMTGEDENIEFRTLLHSFLADLYLGETPTINETTVCTYPEPWYHAHHVVHHAINKKRTPSRSLSDYTGIYNHIAYGNLEIRMNTTVNHLQMNYGIGKWILYPKTSADTFAGEGFGIIYQLWDLYHVKFTWHCTEPLTVVIPGFEPMGPPSFRRIE